MLHSWRQLCQDICLSQRLHWLPLCDRHLHRWEEVGHLHTLLRPYTTDMRKPLSNHDMPVMLAVHQQVSVIASKPCQAIARL